MVKKLNSLMRKSKLLHTIFKTMIRMIMVNMVNNKMMMSKKKEVNNLNGNFC